MAEYVSGTCYRDPDKRDSLNLLDPRATKRVCVIGAGCNGLATLKILAETHQAQSGHWKLVAFEQRDNVGGIWYHP